MSVFTVIQGFVSGVLTWTMSTLSPLRPDFGVDGTGYERNERADIGMRIIPCLEAPA